MAIAGEKTTRKFVGVGALDDPLVNKTISLINQNLKLLQAKRNNLSVVPYIFTSYFYILNYIKHLLDTRDFNAEAEDVHCLLQFLV